MVKIPLQLFGQFFMLIEDVKVSLGEEAQDGVLLHNTWCSGTSCRGINPYTLTARLGPGGLAHYETGSRLDPTAGVSRKETRRGDQAGF